MSSTDGDKHTLLAIMLACLASSLGLSQSVATALLCQFGDAVSHTGLCSWLLAVDAALCLGTVAGVALLLVAAAAARRRQQPPQSEPARRHQYQRCWRWWWKHGGWWRCPCLCLTLAAAVAAPVGMLRLELAYTGRSVEHLLTATNASRLPLVAGDSLALRRHGCPADRFVAAFLSRDEPQPRTPMGSPGWQQESSVCLDEAASFVSLQARVCAFNACLVGALLVICARQVVRARLIRAWRRREQQRQLAEQHDMQ